MYPTLLDTLVRHAHRVSRRELGSPEEVSQCQLYRNLSSKTKTRFVFVDYNTLTVKTFVFLVENPRFVSRHRFYPLSFGMIKLYCTPPPPAPPPEIKSSRNRTGRCIPGVCISLAKNRPFTSGLARSRGPWGWASQSGSLKNFGGCSYSR